jgi:hypothetical protein
LKAVSQPARLAKRRHGKKHKQERHSDGERDEPASCISRPGAKRSIEPAKRKHGKNRADGFMKNLPEGAPEPPETALSLRPSGRPYCRGHESILAQNEADDRKRNETAWSPGECNLFNGTVDGLETTKRSPIVSN